MPARLRPDDADLDGWRAFQAQRDNARRRGIPFLFDFQTWWSWWQVDGRWENRGLGKGKLVMARKGDVGPYSPENVYCSTHEDNIKEATPSSAEARMRSILEGRFKPGQHLRIRGDGHPRSKPVLTPRGRFGSAALAAEEFGITARSAANRAKLQREGWSYLDE